MTARHLLIVDDDKGMLIALTRALAGRWAVCAVPGVAQARALAVTGAAFDASLIDLSLADGNGLALAEQLVRLNESHCGRITFMSGRGVDSSEGGRMAALGATFLQKPLEIGTLLSALESTSEQTVSEEVA